MRPQTTAGIFLFGTGITGEAHGHGNQNGRAAAAHGCGAILIDIKIQARPSLQASVVWDAMGPTVSGIDPIFRPARIYERQIPFRRVSLRFSVSSINIRRVSVFQLSNAVTRHDLAGMFNQNLRYPTPSLTMEPENADRC